MNALPIAITASVLLATSAGDASIPYAPIPEVVWAGPGYLCEANFTLEVKQTEYIREDIQLEPWYPASDTIMSADGWYSVATLPRDKGLMSRKKINSISSTELGEISRYEPIDSSGFEASFIFVPRDIKKPLSEIDFFQVYKSQYSVTDWRIAPQKAYDPGDYNTVLSRFDFSNAPKDICINH